MIIHLRTQLEERRTEAVGVAGPNDFLLGDQVHPRALHRPHRPEYLGDDAEHQQGPSWPPCRCSGGLYCMPRAQSLDGMAWPL